MQQFFDLCVHSGMKFQNPSIRHCQIMSQVGHYLAVAEENTGSRSMKGMSGIELHCADPFSLQAFILEGEAGPSSDKVCRTGCQGEHT